MHENKRSAVLRAEGEKAHSDWQVNQVPPDRMTPEQRRREIASLLANGIARLRSTDSRPFAGRTSESVLALGFFGHQSVHSDPANNTETESK